MCQEFIYIGLSGLYDLYRRFWIIVLPILYNCTLVAVQQTPDVKTYRPGK